LEKERLLEHRKAIKEEILRAADKKELKRCLESVKTWRKESTAYYRAASRMSDLKTTTSLSQTTSVIMDVNTSAMSLVELINTRAGELGIENFKAVLAPADPDPEGGPRDKRCFIATAAAGSVDHPDCAVLRDFRDQALIPRRMGRVLVRAYYRISPPLARIIASSPRLAKGCMALVIRPAALAASLFLSRRYKN